MQVEPCIRYALSSYNILATILHNRMHLDEGAITIYAYTSRITGQNMVRQGSYTVNNESFANVTTDAKHGYAYLNLKKSGDI